MGKGKTTGSGSVTLSGDNDHIKATGNGKIKHQNNGTTIYIEGEISHSKGSGGKGKTQGSGTIGGEIEF
ncbi:MAG: hypothetical protein Barrevirus6_18 [Barrevirus sp.]|uniref:Uncharacterized protein n=1 Tax=Barrevirus sp. TaxID=2487763 RepID=A0A3G4ZQ08_9VIRU|nr:MAG: hypothetical protein Barrevirus6_18 [Barrevirus sp.]